MFIPFCLLFPFRCINGCSLVYWLTIFLWLFVEGKVYWLNKSQQYYLLSNPPPCPLVIAILLSSFWFWLLFVPGVEKRSKVGWVIASKVLHCSVWTIGDCVVLLGTFTRQDRILCHAIGTWASRSRNYAHAIDAEWSLVSHVGTASVLKHKHLFLC